MPLNADQQAALGRLQSYYEGNNPYNSVTNPGGFRQGGHVYNFVSALKDVATVCVGVASLAADVVANSAQSPKAVRVDSAQTFTSDEQVVGQTNLGIAGAFVPKTGGTFTGAIGVSKNGPNLNLFNTGPTTNGKGWNILNNDPDGRLFFQSYTGSTFAGNPFHIGTDGSVTTLQFGDLNSRIEARAAAYSANAVQKTGDTMTGLLTLNYTYPSVVYNYASVRQWASQVREDGHFYLWDNSGGGARFRAQTDGALWCSQLGDINSRIESRGDAYRAAAVNACVTSGRWVYAGDMTSFQSAGSGGFIGAYGGYGMKCDHWTYTLSDGNCADYAHRYRYFQLYTPNGGWVTCGSAS